MNEFRALLSQYPQDFAQNPGSTGIVVYTVYIGAPTYNLKERLLKLNSGRGKWASNPFPILS